MANPRRVIASYGPMCCDRWMIPVRTISGDEHSSWVKEFVCCQGASCQEQGVVDDYSRSSGRPGGES